MLKPIKSVAKILVVQAKHTKPNDLQALHLTFICSKSTKNIIIWISISDDSKLSWHYSQVLGFLTNQPQTNFLVTPKM